MIKLLALDMDGTLLDDQKKLSPKNIEAIHAAVAAGVKLVLCTGRILPGVKPYFDQLQLDAENEYVIVNNGCSTHETKDWKLIDWAELSKEDIEFLAPFARESQTQLTLFDEENYYVVDEVANEFVKADTEVVFLDPVTLPLETALHFAGHLFQGMFVGSQAACDDFQERYQNELCLRFNGVRSQPTIYEVLPQNVSKASALKKLAQQLNIDPADIMAIGDANNDIEMLEFAGVSVAMGNAGDHIKEIADHITASNNENGVAQAIYHYVLES
ncbi:Cof-type HAD-IIB family hydrolase [Streptococcus gallolyticus]|uniref:Cof-type HAD-IIB family hydrolase n=1 Tax=Streptococcus hepaticus TaxID=3349163 RepID=UPI001C950DA1|nr:Cof-type HAD-IIB family hydrolase [Streptococcus gallolyticus]MBY5041564.1 Cof-type HAD-IIB family hydrolase [Streptococcus gallolyticus]